jgi:protein-S-isoprenylcysteine O-methyltransferase Ste14
MTPEIRRKIRKWTLQAAVGVTGNGVVLFASAGSLGWIWGWALLIILAALMAAHPLLLVPRNPELLVERDKGILAEGVKGWDKWITSSSGGMMILIWIVAGLDFRYQWSDSLPFAIHLGGAVLVMLGYALFMWAMLSNPFFSEGVRIQTERDHSVAAGGPYQLVRHPGYLGTIIAHLAMPLLLGSPWAMIPALLLSALFVLRTLLEDKTLMDELPGYRSFAVRIRYRLLPLFW